MHSRMDLTGWTFILDFGLNGQIYGKGSRRVLVDKNTKRVVLEYSMHVQDPKNCAAQDKKGCWGVSA